MVPLANKASTRVPAGFYQASTRLPPGFQQGSTKVLPGGGAGYFEKPQTQNCTVSLCFTFKMSPRRIRSTSTNQYLDFPRVITLNNGVMDLFLKGHGDFMGRGCVSCLKGHTWLAPRMLGRGALSRGSTSVNRGSAPEALPVSFHLVKICVIFHCWF